MTKDKLLGIAVLLSSRALVTVGLSDRGFDAEGYKATADSRWSPDFGERLCDN